MRRRKLSKILALAAIGAAVMAGCASPSGDTGENSNKEADVKGSEESTNETTAKGTDANDAGTEETTLTFWKASANEERNAWWEETIAKFEEEHPEIKVEYLGVAGDLSAFDQKLDMAVAANEAPDIFSSYLDPSYISRGIIEPLDQYYDSWADKDQIPEKYVDLYRDMDYSSDNPKLYATPAGGNVQCLYVRPDLLKEKGLEIPATWDEFFEAEEKTTDKEKGIFGGIIRGGGGNASALEMLMYSYSGITDFFIDGKCTINDPKNVEFVEKYLGSYATYTSEDDINKAWPEMAAQFQSGKGVMMAHNLGSAQANYEAFGNDESKVKAVPYPKSATGKIVIPSFQPAGNMITATSKNKEAAWTFLEWLLSAQETSSYEKMMSNMPVNTEAQKDSWIQETSYMKMGADMNNDENVVFCNFPYYLPNFTNIESDYAMPNIQKVMLGQMTAQELLNGWAEKLQEDYDSVMSK